MKSRATKGIYQDLVLMFIIMVLMELRRQNYSDTPNKLHEFNMINTSVG